MSLFAAMTASVSGLNAQGEAISVISDNLSNTNTVGFKSARTLFSQLVTSSGVGGTDFNAGGTDSSVFREQNAQGSFISTSSVTDLALSGSGFFVVTDSQTITTDTEFFYTRAGAFSEDKAGFLVDPSGNYLQGWRTDSDGNILTVQNPESIELQSTGVSAQATSTFILGANINRTASVSSIYDTTSSLATDLDALVLSPNSAELLIEGRLFDAQGGARDVTIGLTKRGENFWDWTMFTDGSNIQGGTSGTNTRISSGTVRYNLDGSLREVTGNSSVNVSWSGGVAAGVIDINFGDQTGGLVTTATTDLDYTDDVHDIALEGTLLTSGTTYDLVFTGPGTVEIQPSGGGTAIDTTTVATTSSLREIYFSTADMRMTISANFNAAPGSYPNTIGDFTVGTAALVGTGTGTNGVAQSAATSNTNFTNQNGFGAGTLSAIQVDGDGFISGTFTNGETKKLWKVSVAVFQNPSGLEVVSQSLLRVTDSSGQPLLKEAGVGSTASIKSGALEGSTVDIANEFSQMIISQRAYQASSTVISTVDQMLQQLMQLR